MTVRNLLAPLESKPGAEVFEPLLGGGAFRLERIVSTGQATPAGEWYDQPEDEFVLLLAGSATLRFEAAGGEGPDEVVDLSPGDWLRIPAGRRHRVERTDPAGETVWLALHFRADAAGAPQV